MTTHSSSLHLPCLLDRKGQQPLPWVQSTQERGDYDNYVQERHLKGKMTEILMLGMV